MLSEKNCVIFYGYGTDDLGGWNWRKDYDHIPTVAEVRADIEALVNAKTDEVINARSLITGTTTISGLSISCTIDSNIYNLKNRIFSDDEFNEIPIEYFEEWLPMWNYSINAN